VFTGVRPNCVFHLPNESYLSKIANQSYIAIIHTLFPDPEDGFSDNLLPLHFNLLNNQELDRNMVRCAIYNLQLHSVFTGSSTMNFSVKISTLGSSYKVGEAAFYDLGDDLTTQ